MSCHHHLAVPPPEEQDPSPPPSSGYRKLTLPLLRRCISDPYNPPSSNPLFDHSRCGGGCGGCSSLPNMTPPHHSPDHDHHYPNPKTPSHSPTLPPLPPSQTLRRTVSDVNPSPAKSSRFSTSPQDLGSDIGTPNSKRLRRMKDRLREMSLWCQQLMQEEEFMEVEDQDEEQVVEEEEQQEVQAVDATDHQDFHSNAAATNEDECEKVFAESVSVEKKNDCLIIHFRCHCDKAYQFLLSGGECYYKLM